MQKKLTQREKDRLMQLSKKFSNTQQFQGGKYHLKKAAERSTPKPT